jgi:hypothetical protein
MTAARVWTAAGSIEEQDQSALFSRPPSEEQACASEVRL